MRINLLDPGLLKAGGHFLEWDLRIVDELISIGHDVAVYSHVNINPEARQAVVARAQLIPIFHVSPFESPRQIDAISGELTIFLDGAVSHARALGSVRQADVWLWPTMLASHLYACALVKPEAMISACIHFPPSYMAQHGNMWWRYAFLKAKQAELKLDAGVPLPILQKHYARLSGRDDIRLLPVAHDGVRTSGRKTRLKKIGFFGAQRPEKGSHLLPELISKLLQDGYQVVLHDSGNLVQAKKSADLTVLGYVPSLPEEIAQCDLIVLPYHPEAYRNRGSGVVWDAIASGIPVVAPANTSPGRWVAELGTGKLFVLFTADDIYRAIKEVDSQYAGIAGKAFAASERWLETHGVKNFVRAILGE